MELNGRPATTGELASLALHGYGHFTTMLVTDLRVRGLDSALPKTRSGKILRKTMRSLADGRDEPVPSTIEDPAVLDALRGVLREG